MKIFLLWSVSPHRAQERNLWLQHGIFKVDLFVKYKECSLAGHRVIALNSQYLSKVSLYSNTSLPHILQALRVILQTNFPRLRVIARIPPPVPPSQVNPKLGKFWKRLPTCMARSPTLSWLPCSNFPWVHLENLQLLYIFCAVPLPWRVALMLMR